MAKVALLADIHIGYGNRLNDIMWGLKVVRDYCSIHKIDKVIVLGDLFHDRESISIDALCAAYDFFKETRHTFDQEWVAFPGNHDMFLRHSWDISSLRPLSDVLTIIDDVKIAQINGGRFWILPFVYSEKSYMKILGEIEKQHKKDDVLLTHIGICAAQMNICFLLQNWSLVSFGQSRFDKVFAGHYHIHQNVGCATYVGSIIPFKFDEGDSDHGFIVYDTSTREHEFVNIFEVGAKSFPDETPPPDYCSFHDELLDDKKPRDVLNKNIRVMTTKEYTTNERQRIRDNLIDMGARLVTFTSLLKESDEEQVEVSGEVEAIKAEELFAKWFDADTRGTKGLQRNLAVRLNLEIIQEGDEKYEAER